MDETLGKVILQVFGERAGNRKIVCSLCGGTRWAVDGTACIPIQDNIGGGIVIGGKVLPLANLTCEVCGNTLFINILRLLGKEKFEDLLRQNKANQILQEAHRSLEQKGGQSEEDKT